MNRYVHVGAWIVALAACGVVFGQSPAGSADQVYERRCATCHGLDGKGSGPAAAGLRVRPRDFVAGKYKIRSTASGSIPPDEDLARVIRSGMHGTAMPDWELVLSQDDTAAVVAHVKSFSPRFKSEQPAPVAVAPAIQPTPASVDQGKSVYAKMQCAKCHGASGDGQGATAEDLKDDSDHDTRATNLTEPWTFRGGSSP